MALQKKDYVFFWKPTTNFYKYDKWRSIFCQWKMNTFTGGDGIHDLDELLGENKALITDQIFVCCEQWMMAIKALAFAKGVYKANNIKIFYKIMDSSMMGNQVGSVVRKLGRSITGFLINEHIWEKWKYQIVVNGNYLQFSQTEEFKKILLDTGDKKLVEASPFDKIWGIGFDETNAMTYKDNWGKNLLGLALEEVRHKIRENIKE
jgi:ribA/ribD-fused uncharacterized protein